MRLRLSSGSSHSPSERELIIADPHASHSEKDGPSGTVFLESGLCLISLLTGLALHAWWAGRMMGASIETPWFVLLAYGVSFASGGAATLVEALIDLRRGLVNIDLLMILAAVGAALLGDWPEGAVLLFLFSLSHALEHFILGRTRSAIAGLMKLTPDEAVVLREGREQTIRVEELVIGDRVLVHPSDRIPIDGILRDGHTTVDQSPMIGLLLTTLITVLPLPLAVLGHEGSTVLVILNGLRMLTFPKPVATAG